MSAILLALLFAVQQLTFHAGTNLVLVPFEFKSKVQLASKDITLLEAGVPRSFTIFQTPADPSVLDLAILFDQTNRERGGFWDDKDLQALAKGWDSANAQAILGIPGAASVRISVYLLDRSGSQRLSRNAAGAAELAAVMHRLASPIAANQPLDLALDADPNSLPTGRAIAIFSTGLKNGSGNLVPAALASNAPLYPIAFATHKGAYASGELESAPLAFDEAFRQLASVTGGRSFDATDSMTAAQMRDILTKVEAHALARARSQYAVGFIAAQSESPKYHRLEIKLAAKREGKLTGGKKSLQY